MTNISNAAFVIEAPGPAVVGATGSCSRWSYFVDHTSYADYINAITGDDESIYIAGERGYRISVNTNSTAIIEKRNQKTGLLDPVFGNAGVLAYEPSTIRDEVVKIKHHGSSIYTIVRYDIGSGNVGISLGQPKSSFMLEKRNATTGALEWSYNYTELGTTMGFADLYVDDSGIYTSIGTTGNVANSNWKVQKRSLVNGQLISNFSTNGTFSENLSYGSIQKITGDNEFIYVAGVFLSNDGINTLWKVSKINKSTGVVVWNQVYDPPLGTKYFIGIDGIAVDNTGLYLSGSVGLKDPTSSDSTNLSTYTRARLEKRSLVDGSIMWSNEESVVFNSSQEYSIADIAISGNDLYTVGPSEIEKKGASETSYHNATYVKRDSATGAVKSIVTKDVGAYMRSVFIGKNGVFAGGVLGTSNWSNFLTQEGLNMSLSAKWYIENIDTSVCDDEIKFMDIGLRINQGTLLIPDITHIAVEIEGMFRDDVSSKLRIVKNNKIYRIALVEVNDPNASKARISLGNGVVKSLRACTPTNGCLYVP